MAPLSRGGGCHTRTGATGKGTGVLAEGRCLWCCHGGGCFPPLFCLLILQGWEPSCCSREVAPSPAATLPLPLLLKPERSVRDLIPPRPGWAALEVFMCLELAGDYVREGRISWPPGWDLQLRRLFSSPRAGAHTPCLLPPGKWRRATVQLGVREPVQPHATGRVPQLQRDPQPGRAGNTGGRWQLESRIWAEPPPWGCPGGHTVGLTPPLIPKLTHRRVTNTIQHLAPSWTSTSRWLWPRSGRTRSAPARGHPRWTGARKMNCSATCERP